MISDIQWARSSNMRAAMTIFDATLLKNCYLSVLDNMDDEFLNDYCKSAEVHCQVRQYARTIAKPGISMSKLAQEIEDGIRALTNHQGIETGDALKAVLGFPTGLCLTNIGAH
ncbi:methionine aminopeptidase 2-2 [Paracoccidioides brasiliensis]|nr:methionine aminopeptidase 2-2 [Paracoccidioides brasiliensis]